jgi:hypothetical protein
MSLPQPETIWPSHRATRVDDVPAVEVGLGCTRRDLPSNPGVRVWIVDMAPGSRWPSIDHHNTGEEVYVVSGELIEGDARHGAGTFVSFVPGSQHQPRTESGARLLGLNLGMAAYRATVGELSLPSPAPPAIPG